MQQPGTLLHKPRLLVTCQLTKPTAECAPPTVRSHGQTVNVRATWAQRVWRSAIQFHVRRDLMRIRHVHDPPQAIGTHPRRPRSTSMCRYRTTPLVRRLIIRGRAHDQALLPRFSHHYDSMYQRANGTIASCMQPRACVRFGTRSEIAVSVARIKGVH